MPIPDTSVDVEPSGPRRRRPGWRDRLNRAAANAAKRAADALRRRTGGRS